jgi:hypothetical protein
MFAFAVQLAGVWAAVIIAVVGVSRQASLGEAREYAFVYALLACLANTAFVYTNYVTTRRNSLFRGAHGGFRDLLIVNAALPLITVWSQLAAPGRLFLAPSTDVPGQPPAIAAFGGPYTVGAALAVGLFLGVHFLYLARVIRFDGSISRVDAASGVGAVAIMAVKICLLSALSADHFLWLHGQGRLWEGLGALAAVLAVGVYITQALESQYYVHLHHWICGLLLLPFAVGTSPVWSAVLIGFALGQFVEGAARWSCAPLWHVIAPHHRELLKATGRSEKGRKNNRSVDSAVGPTAASTKGLGRGVIGTAIATSSDSSSPSVTVVSRSRASVENTHISSGRRRGRSRAVSVPAPLSTAPRGASGGK